MAACDICETKVKGYSKDITNEARAVVGVLSKLPGPDQRLTLIQLIGQWRGSKVNKLPNESSWGICKDALKENYQPQEQLTFWKIAPRTCIAEIFVCFSQKPGSAEVASWWEPRKILLDSSLYAAAVSRCWAVTRNQLMNSLVAYFGI